jgi:hypothetical protein
MKVWRLQSSEVHGHAAVQSIISKCGKPHCLARVDHGNGVTADSARELEAQRAGIIGAAVPTLVG